MQFPRCCQCPPSADRNRVTGQRSGVRFGRTAHFYQVYDLCTKNSVHYCLTVFRVCSVLEHFNEVKVTA